MENKTQYFTSSKPTEKNLLLNRPIQWVRKVNQEMITKSHSESLTGKLLYPIKQVVIWLLLYLRIVIDICDCIFVYLLLFLQWGHTQRCSGLSLLRANSQRSSRDQIGYKGWKLNPDWPFAKPSDLFFVLTLQSCD